MRQLAALLAGLSITCASGAMAGTVDLPLQIGGAYAVPVHSLREVRDAATVRQRYDYSCGSAALATLLSHQYRSPVGEDRVFDEMFSRGDQAKIKVEGFSLLDMKRYLQAHGFDADGFREPLDTLVEARIPAIVLLNENGYRHFVVIKGVRNGRILIGDPAAGTRVVTRRAFEASWVNGVLFVIGNRQDLARFNADTDWRAAPLSPLADSIDRGGLSGVSIPRLGPADF